MYLIYVKCHTYLLVIWLYLHWLMFTKCACISLAAATAAEKPPRTRRNFKFRLPSLRKSMQLQGDDVDVENPPEGLEESVPLQRLSPGEGAQSLQPEGLMPNRRGLSRELSNLSTLSNDDFRSGSRSSQGSIRRASSLEHINSRSPGRARLKSTGSGIPSNIIHNSKCC